MKRRGFEQTVAPSAPMNFLSVGRGWAIVALLTGCGEQSLLAGVVPIDGGVAVIDGGVAVIDGGVGIIDGGVGLVDGGVAVIDGGVAVIDGGVAVIDGGVAVIDGGVAVIDGGVGLIDGGVATIDGGVGFIDGGVGIIDGGVVTIDGGVATIDGGVGIIDGGAGFIDGGVRFIDGGTAPTCSDGVANGAETGVDCGGPSCAPCTCYTRITPQRTYRVCSGTYTWSQARSACVAFGAELASARTAAENNEINQAFESAYVAGIVAEPVGWLGGTDTAMEGTWRWTTGVAVGFSAWMSGEPNNGTGPIAENCMVTCVPLGQALGFCGAFSGWNDVRCDATFRQFACVN